MSTRSSYWCSPEVRGRAIHMYREMLNGWVYLEAGRNHGFRLRVAPSWRLVRRWLGR